MASEEPYEDRENEDDDDFELKKLREKAKIASIYHTGKEKFQRNPNLSHVVHAGLHIFQFMISLAIEIFHHVHHFVIKKIRKEDESIPTLPEERNPIFYVYPICMVFSVVFAVLWLVTKICEKRPIIVLVGCFTAAFLMLLAGIMEMKHIDIHVNLDEVTDEELLRHPVFIHNFIMCLLSIFCMLIYLIQGWILFDYWRWSKEQGSIDDASNDLRVSDSSADTDISESRGKVNKHESKEKNERGKLDPIPGLEEFPSLTSISRTISINVDEEPVILYCCFVDCYNYIRHVKMTRPMHEFQVIHVM